MMIISNTAPETSGPAGQSARNASSLAWVLAGGSWLIFASPAAAQLSSTAQPVEKGASTSDPADLSASSTSAEPGGPADPAAKDPAADPTAIYVYGRGERRIGQAGAASEGGVAGADIQVRPLLRPGELLEATPGLIATQHSGGGKANQFFLRGFNLDHGTDYAGYIDDVPMNFRTHGHGQGYLDVNGLIPETVERIDYRKGPYRADTGDFSFVGASFISSRNKIAPFATVEVGSYGYRRYVAGGSVAVGGGNLLGVIQRKLNDGPWELPEDFSSVSALLKYSAPLGDGELFATGNLYHATWAPTEQLPERAIGTPLCADRFCSLDTTLRGETKREIATLGYRSDDWKVTAYAQHYDWNLSSNFTFFLADPINGDQLRQYDNRWIYGGRIEHTAQLGEHLSLRTGAEGRVDDIAKVGFDQTVAGAKLLTVGAFDVLESSLGVYAEAVWRPIDRLMLIGGVRNDWYRFRTTALEGVGSWSGLVMDDIFAPKIGANYELADGVALYANYGGGFHSNDARGVTSPDHPAPGLVGGNFEEVGVRFERGGAILTAVYWWSSIDSELIYVGDSGAVEPSDPGRRRGYELTGFYKPNGWLAIDAVWTGSHARYAGLPEGENFVPGSLESSGEVGVSAIFPDFNASARLRYLGPHPLIEDNSQRGTPTLLLNARVAWTPRRLAGWSLYADLLNVFDSKDDDIDYYYETRLPGEPPEGVLGRNSRIVEPRQLRVGLSKSF